MEESFEEDKSDEELSQENVSYDSCDEKTEKAIVIVERLQNYIQANGLNMLTKRFAASDMESLLK